MGTAETGDRGFPIRFIASREDGLCMRLLALLNAMRLARAYDGAVGLIWSDEAFAPQDGHTTEHPERIFAPDALSRYRAQAQPEGGPVLAPTPIDAGGLALLMQQARQHGALRVERPGDLSALLARMGGTAPVPATATLFEDIGFAAPVRAAIAAAHALPMPMAATGLHLRGGDIVHGSNSNRGSYAHKAVSVFEAEAVAERVRSEGGVLWLLGQEPDLMAHLVARFDHVRAVPPCDPALGAEAAVLHDVVVLSRLSRVYGGNSAVSRLAAMLGPMEWVDLLGLDLGLTPARFCDDPLSGPDYAGLSGHQRAFSCYKLIYLATPEDWTQAHLTVAKAMLAHRPRWQFGRLVLACLLAHLGDREAAEVECACVLAPEGHEGWPDVVRHHVLAAHDPFPAEQIACLAGADPARHPASAHLYGLVFGDRG